MTDKTTMGITAAPEEVEAVLLNLCGYHLSESDPVFRYTVLTREQVLYDALVTAIKRERGRALAELVEKGHKLTEVAELTGLGTRQRVQRLIQLAKVERAIADAQAASREFDERLAAVEATLDEVVSGLPPAAPVDNTPAETKIIVDASTNEDFADVMVKDDAGFGDPELLDEDRWEEAPFSLQSMAEPTQVIPVIRTVTEDVPWWRRSA